VKLSVIALDYDGTIATHGRAERDALAAIQEARSHGVIVILVTGRILSDLERVLPERSSFDAIVAENGAMLAFPSGRTRALARPPAQTLLEELRRLGVAFETGDCIIEADAGSAPQILAAIRTVELPLTILFNRNRVMVLPQGISKATGLREILKTLRLSLHNCIGIGDAENDYAMLDACEIGAAAAWGSKSLHEIADDIVPGAGPSAVGNYIRAVSANTKLPPQRADNRRILLGHTTSGEIVETAVHGRNILIAGDPRSGKSWITGLFCEQLILQGYCLCLIDPEGDYATFESLPGVVVLRASENPPSLAEVGRALRYPDVSLVIGLSSLGHEQKVNYLHELLPMLASLRRSVGLPHWIVVDEAHYFLHHPNLVECVDFELAAYILVTYRPSQLHPDLLSAVESTIVTPFTNPDEVRTLATLAGAADAQAEWSKILGSLEIDEAAIVPRNGAASLPKRFTITRRITSHVRHRMKYTDVPMPVERAFVFTSNGKRFGPPVRTLKEFVRLQERVPQPALEAHARRGDFSRWIHEVFGDEPLAADIRAVEKQFRRGEIKSLGPVFSKLVRERYTVQQPGRFVSSKPDAKA
jgi:hydroxymethylpyrimidine pyrophosphatase-like HAD family hydrolase